MPPWLLILILVEGVIFLINPSSRDFAWYQGLRRPSWVPFVSSLPLIWLLIHSGIYLSSLVIWNARHNWNLILPYILLLVLVQGSPWMMCRRRRLAIGALLCLLGWVYALILAAALLPVSSRASALLLPYLLWAPVEALIIWDMRRLNKGC